MKVCPQCDFIYEDDQGLCDMDGVHLVYDATPLALAVQDPAGLVKPRWRSFAGTAVIGVILGPLLFLVYHVSARRAAPPDTNYSASQVSNDSAAPNADLEAPVLLAPSNGAMADASSDASSDASPQPSDSEPSESEFGRSPQLLKPSEKAGSNVAPSVKLSSAPSRPPAPTRKSARANREPEDAHQKKESKINSFLKKTGQILKKPFKF